MQQRNRLSVRALSGLIPLMVGVSAMAQVPPTSPDSEPKAADTAAATTTGTAGGTQLEDIEVTAQRRAQRLQDVPVAVTAFPAAEIESAASATSAI